MDVACWAIIFGRSKAATEGATDGTDSLSSVKAQARGHFRYAVAARSRKRTARARPDTRTFLSGPRGRLPLQQRGDAACERRWHAGPLQAVGPRDRGCSYRIGSLGYFGSASRPDATEVAPSSFDSVRAGWRREMT